MTRCRDGETAQRLKRVQRSMERAVIRHRYAAGDRFGNAARVLPTGQYGTITQRMFAAFDYRIGKRSRANRNYPRLQRDTML